MLDIVMQFQLLLLYLLVMCSSINLYHMILHFDFTIGWLLLQSLISTQSRLVIASSENSSSADSVLSSDAICVEVPTDDIRVGDSVLVLPGETIPVDVSVSDCLLSSPLFKIRCCEFFTSKEAAYLYVVYMCAVIFLKLS